MDGSGTTKHDQSFSSNDWAGAALKRHPHLQLVSDAVALIAKLSLPVGGIYLFYYCVEMGIPFPTSLTELPALLVTVAAVGLFATALVVGFAFGPALMRTDMLGGGYDLLYQDEKGRWRTLISLLLVPLFLLTYALLATSMLTSPAAKWAVGLISSAVISASFVIGIRWRLPADRADKQGKRKRAKGALANACLAAAAQIVTCFFWTFGVLFLLVEYEAVNWIMDLLPTSLSNRDFIGLAALVGMPVLGVGGVVWLGIHDRYRPSSIKKALPLPISLLIGTMMVSLLFPMASAWAARLALIPLGLGGGQAVCYAADPKMPAPVRKELGFDERGNLKRPLRVALDLGPRLFLLPSERQPEEKATAFPSEWFLYRHRPSKAAGRGVEPERRSEATCKALGESGKPSSTTPK